MSLCYNISGTIDVSVLRSLGDGGTFALSMDLLMDGMVQ